VVREEDGVGEGVLGGIAADGAGDGGVVEGVEGGGALGGRDRDVAGGRRGLAFA
jgi:hypothetical protein